MVDKENAFIQENITEWERERKRLNKKSKCPHTIRQREDSELADMESAFATPSNTRPSSERGLSTVQIWS